MISPRKTGLGAGHVVNLLDEGLSRRKPPRIDVLLALCPDEPLAVDDDRGGRTAAQYAKLWRGIADLRARYPGLQAAHWKLENMKFGHEHKEVPFRPLPDLNAPLTEFVRTRISHAKALWSRDVLNGWTRLQFRDWLRLHVNGETWIPPVWPDDSVWSEALLLLRIAYGLPRFGPRFVLRDPPRRVRAHDDEH